MSEERHVLQLPRGRTFSVYQQDVDMDELKGLLVDDRLIPTRYHCEECGAGSCAHVEALVKLGLL